MAHSLPEEAVSPCATQTLWPPAPSLVQSRRYQVAANTSPPSGGVWERPAFPGPWGSAWRVHTGNSSLTGASPPTPTRPRDGRQGHALRLFPGKHARHWTADQRFHLRWDVPSQSSFETKGIYKEDGYHLSLILKRRHHWDEALRVQEAELPIRSPSYVTRSPTGSGTSSPALFTLTLGTRGSPKAKATPQTRTAGQ
ncbi:uncharacterized protein LOC144376952 [Ictidomys tridecemlineatus]